MFCGRHGDVAPVEGISRPKQRFILSFGPFFVLLGCLFDALQVGQCGIGDVVLEVVVVTVGWQVELRWGYYS